jgi:hypothetical protein
MGSHLPRVRSPAFRSCRTCRARNHRRPGSAAVRQVRSAATTPTQWQTRRSRGSVIADVSSQTSFVGTHGRVTGKCRHEPDTESCESSRAGMANLWGVVITVLACCLRKDFALDFNPDPVPIPPVRPGGPDVGPRPPNRTSGPRPLGSVGPAVDTRDGGRAGRGRREGPGERASRSHAAHTEPLQPTSGSRR